MDESAPNPQRSRPHSHADPAVAHNHAPTQFDEESAVDTQSDDPFQFDYPPVPAPVILSQPNPVYDHRDDLPHHIRTQLQSRIRKPAQNLEPDAKRLRLDAGKRTVLMLSHDVSSGPECCKPVTIFKSCENSGCADVLLTRRAANKEVQCDALMKTQQVRVDAATIREWDKWNEFGVMKFFQPRPESRGNQGLHREGHPGQLRPQSSTCCSRVSRGQGLHQD